MDIIISGYGRMGKEIEKACLKMNHRIIAKVDNDNDWKKISGIDRSNTVVIDFSMPDDGFREFPDARLGQAVPALGGSS